MNALKTIKFLSALFYLLYMLFFSIESKTETLKKEGTPLVHSSRGPDSFVAGDQVNPLPLEKRLWVQDVFIEDDVGVLVNIKGQINTWQQMEQHRQQWNIGSTGLYDTPQDVEKKNILGGRF